MHEFYRRVQAVFERAGSNRSQFCKKHGFNYQTLQGYWNSDRLPPGNVLEALARDLDVSLDALVLGREPAEAGIENSIVGRLTHFLRRQDYRNLLRIEGALKLFEHFETGDEAGQAAAGQEADPAKMEKVSDLLTRLALRIQEGAMSARDKESARQLLNQIVRNIYERETDDEWATLEPVD
jgi:transcriptional regulator with XRE-family HTH domain